MSICPVCNGLMDFTKYCPKCGEKMQVYDRIENYYDDYSPYLSYDLTDLNDGDPGNICSHICYCINCGNREVARINNILE